MQDFYRCQEGYKDRADVQAARSCKKLVKDMHYKARVQAVIDYWAERGMKYVKEVARTIFMTREQYIEVNMTLVISNILRSSTHNLILYLLSCRRFRGGVPRIRMRGR